MVGTRDRVPLGIGLSSEISAGILAGGGPARVPIRFPRYPVFKVPGASSAPPRRFLPSAAQGDILRAPPPAVKGLSRLFPEKGASWAVFAVRPGATRFYCPSCPAHIPSISPGRGVLVRCGASRCAKAGADQMFLSPTNQVSPVPRHSEQLSGRIIRSEIRRRGRRVTIYSNFLPRRDISRFIVAPLL